MQIINEAWAVLSNPQKRSKYDAELAKREEMEKFLREMDEKVAKTEHPAEEDATPIDPEIVVVDIGLETEKREYANKVGLSWVESRKKSAPRKRPEPTYAVFRTDFEGGDKTYYYYAIDSYEVARRCGRTVDSPKPLLKGSRVVSCRIVTQELMDRIMEGNGVLWVEGTPKGDVTLKFLG